MVGPRIVGVRQGVFVRQPAYLKNKKAVAAAYTPYWEKHEDVVTRNVHKARRFARSERGRALRSASAGYLNAILR